MVNPSISFKMEKEKYSEEGNVKVEIIKNCYTIPEGLIKEEIVIKRTLLKSKFLKEANKIQTQLDKFEK